MKDFTIFKKEYSSLFTEHGYGVVTIQYILHGLGYDLFNLNTSKAREDGLLAIKQLFEYKIIKLTFLNGDLFTDESIQTEEKIEKIANLWNVGETEFETIAKFDYQDWYYKKMNQSGINENTDWDWFENIFVPNMEKWIEENRPK